MQAIARDPGAPVPRVDQRAAYPASGILQRIDRAVMGFLEAPGLNYRGEVADVLRLPLRVARNLTVMAYTPLRVAGLILSSPLASFQQIPAHLAELARSLFSLEALLMVLTSHAGAALTVSLGIGSSLPLSAFYAGAMALITLRGVGEFSGRAAVGRALLLALESMLFGWVVGRSISWWMRKQFAPQLDALRQQISATYQLPPASAEFVNTNGEPLLIFSGERAREFLAQNPELAADFAARYRRHFQWAPYCHAPAFSCSQVVVGTEQGVTAMGSCTWGDQRTSWAIAHQIPSGQSVRFPCLNAQRETLRVWEGSLAMVPAVAVAANRRPD